MVYSAYEYMKLNSIAYRIINNEIFLLGYNKYYNKKFYIFITYLFQEGLI
jgi:hypothetical protein